MATLLKDYLHAKPRSERDEKGWLMVERGMRVTDVGGSGYSLHRNALKVWGMPGIGHLHPSINGMEVTGYRFDTIDDDVVDVYVIYKRRDEEDNDDYGELEVGTSLHQVETNRDASWALMSATYTPTGGTAKTYKPRFIIDGSTSSLTYRRRESVDPSEKSQSFVGKANSGSWSIGGMSVGGAARTWKCTYLGGTSRDGGKTWDVTYTFEYEAGTWDAESLYHDDTGGVPGDVVDGGNGYSKRTIATVNFGSI